MPTHKTKVRRGEIHCQKTRRNTCLIEAPSLTVANASGEYDGEFIKVWTIVSDKKMLLATYISPNRTRELSTAEDIVYSINFDTNNP